jgi:hypothetical protein
MTPTNGVIISRINEHQFEVFSLPGVKFIVNKNDVIETSKHTLENNLIKFKAGRRIDISAEDKRSLLRVSCQRLSIEKVPDTDLVINYDICAAGQPEKCRILRKALKRTLKRE